MPKPIRVLIVDGYPKASRDQFREVGMGLAWELYRDLLVKHLPDAEWQEWISGDPDSPPAPTNQELKDHFDAVLWPGCNKTVYHDDDATVQAHLDLSRRCYQLGLPQFGSCWGIQVAAVAAGGGVHACPKGREMGLAVKIRLTDAGRTHPMFEGKPDVYSHFVSHDDEVCQLPSGAVHLAGNDWSPVQAAEYIHENGVFWATQYHPEYNLHEMARLITAREERLVKAGYFCDGDDLRAYVAKLDALYANPHRKDLRWQLKIDDDVLDDDIRECEFKNWLKYVVLA